MTYVPGMYFKDGDEADAWLEFDAGAAERELFSFRYPDQYEEWSQWRAAWDAGAFEIRS